MIITKVLISGKVQGVFFRANTKEKADQLNLKGWVKNLSSGKVEALFQGPEEKVEQMIKWCQTGSPNSQVTSVAKQQITKKEQQETTEKLKGFEIRY